MDITWSVEHGPTGGFVHQDRPDLQPLTQQMPLILGTRGSGCLHASLDFFEFCNPMHATTATNNVVVDANRQTIDRGVSGR